MAGFLEHCYHESTCSARDTKMSLLIVLLSLHCELHNPRQSTLFLMDTQVDFYNIFQFSISLLSFF